MLNKKPGQIGKKKTSTLTDHTTDIISKSRTYVSKILNAATNTNLWRKWLIFFMGSSTFTNQEI